MRHYRLASVAQVDQIRVRIGGGMNKVKHQGELGEVYAAGTSTKIAEIYDGWSSTYDEYMKQAGYRHPAICASFFPLSACWRAASA